MVKTAKQHIGNIIDLESKRKREQRQHTRAVNVEQIRRESYEYMRDELMSAVRNSGMSFADIHGRCGPHPKTLEKYALRETTYPQMRKMQSTADIIGMRWSLTPK